MEDIKVQIAAGEVILKKPKSKPFSVAMENAETSNGELKMTKFFNELLPHCIKTHPWGMIPVRDALGNLEIEDYLKLFNQLKNLINVSQTDVGKSEPLSTATDSQKSSG